MDATAAGPALPGGWRRYSSLLFLLGLGAVTALVSLNPLGPCSFRAVTGAPCPGCGMTRACVALLRGDLAASLRFHPLGLPVLLLGAATLFLAVREGVAGKPVLRSRADRWGPAVMAAGIALLAGVWVVRVVLRPEWAPDPLRPGSLAARLLE